MAPTIIFLSGKLLPPSETFIRAQGESLKAFTPYYVGSRFVKGLPLPSDRTFVINQGGMLGQAREGLFKVTGFAPSLYQTVAQLHPALIHAHFGVCGALALPLAKRLKLPLVVTFYGLDATLKAEESTHKSLTHWVYFRRQEALKRETQLFIAVSNFIKQKLLAQGFPDDRVIAHYYGVDTQLFRADPTIPREPVVLFVGRLIEKKGCEYLIRAMAEVQMTHPHVELVLIGEGTLRPELEALADQKLARYRFLGLQPPEVVKQWMNRATLFVAPSVTASDGDSEGLPTVVVEAQSMGLPVVGFIHAGIPEAVLHGETGFLAIERDWQQLAKYISQLLEDGDLWKRFSRDGQTRIRHQFDLQHQTRVLEALYQKSLSIPTTLKFR